jgi:hypothetical protein
MTTTNDRDYDYRVQTENKYGEWVPSIPEPEFIGYKLRHCKCDCGEKFATKLAYRSHYALIHILGLS